MEKIDEELDALAFGGDKYKGFSSAEKAAIFKKLQAEMTNLIKVAKENDPTKLSLSQLNKKSHDLQKRIREIADNPNIPGTVTEGPKKDMIAAIYDSEHAALSDAKTLITKKNSELKYGKKYPVLDPENDRFIILGLDEFGHPNKMGRFTGKFSATKDKTGELTSSEGTSFYDKWNAKTGTMRKEGEEVFHETLNREGKVIMSNPEYKLPKTEPLDIQTEFYTDLSTSDLAKKGYELKQIDMIVKGRKVREYLDKTKSKDTSISMHEQTSTNEIGAVLEDLYNRGDDIYKMTMKEWVTKIPEYFAGGGRVAYGEGTGGISNFFKNKLRKFTKEGRDEAKEKWLNDKGIDLTVEEWDAKPFKEKLAIWAWKGQMWMPEMEKGVDYATGGVANLFRQRQGYRDAGSVIRLAKGARWVIRMLKELADDMIFGKEQFAKMAEPEKIKLYKETQAAIKHLESGGPIPENLIQNLRQDARFKDLTVSKTGDKDFIEIQEVVLESKFPQDMRKFMGKPLKTEDFVEIDLMEFKKTLPKDLLDKVNQIPVEKQTNLLTVMKRAFDAAKKGNVDKGVDVLQEQLLTDFIPKGKPHATGGLIDGYATGGVSNLFRRR